MAVHLNNRGNGKWNGSTFVVCWPNDRMKIWQSISRFRGQKGSDRFQITSQKCDITFGLGTPLCKPDKNDKIHGLFYWTNGNPLNYVDKWKVMHFRGFKILPCNHGVTSHSCRLCLRHLVTDFTHHPEMKFRIIIDAWAVQHYISLLPLKSRNDKEIKK